MLLHDRSAWHMQGRFKLCTGSRMRLYAHQPGGAAQVGMRRRPAAAAGCHRRGLHNAPAGWLPAPQPAARHAPACRSSWSRSLGRSSSSSSSSSRGALWASRTTSSSSSTSRSRNSLSCGRSCSGTPRAERQAPLRPLPRPRLAGGHSRRALAPTARCGAPGHRADGPAAALCCAVLQVVLELAASKASLDFHSPVVEAAFGSFHCSCLRGWDAVGGACLGLEDGGGGWSKVVLVASAGMARLRGWELGRERAGGGAVHSMSCTAPRCTVLLGTLALWQITARCGALLG
jgi:hypothetical protein